VHPRCEKYNSFSGDFKRHIQKVTDFTGWPPEEPAWEGGGRWTQWRLGHDWISRAGRLQGK
jgi:hypothetical protein